MTWVRRLLLYPVLILSGFHLLMTGSPVPLWHVEELRSPVPVRTVTERHLVLADGRAVALPFIEQIPHGDPLFRAALAEGVEVGPDREVHGLLWQDRYCGNSPVVWIKVRVNLSDLAGALHPQGIDDSIVPPEAIAHLAESESIDSSEPARREGRIKVWDRSKMGTIRKQFESSLALRSEGDDG